MTWLSWQAGDDGKWLFGVFTFSFLLLAAMPFAARTKPRSQPELTTSTGFVPHWFMLFAMLVLLCAILLGVGGALLR